MSKQADVVVIGGGPAGYSAAMRLGQAGLEVICVEKEAVGGVCLNWGCIPSKTLITLAERYEFAKHGAELGLTIPQVSLDMQRAMQRSRAIVHHHTSGVSSLLLGNGVLLLRGTARLDGDRTVVVTGESGRQVISARRAIVIATGASPRGLAGFSPDEQRVRTARSAVFLEHVPEHLVVLGGGVIGLELGSAWQRLGAKLSVVELGKELLPGVDRDAARLVERRLRARGAQVLLESRALEWRATGTGLEVLVQEPTGRRWISGSEVLVAAGFVPHTDGLGLSEAGVLLDAQGHIRTDQACRTSVPGIFAIGDVSGPPYLAHKAYAEANVVVPAVLGHPAVRDWRAMPAAIFTDPEIATLGLSEDAARREGRVVSVGKFPFSASGRAMARNQGEGFVKLIAENGYLQGATIVGPEASELVAELSLAIEVGASLDDLSLTVHPHPTLSEAVHDAADHALGRAIHVPNRRSSPAAPGPAPG